MNQQDHTGPARQPDALEELLRITPLRQPPPAEDAASVRAAVHAAWLGEVQGRQRFRWTWAAAALLVAAIAVLVLRQSPPGSAAPMEVATIDTVVGRVVTAGPGGDAPLTAGDRLSSGQSLTTPPDARLTVLWNGGIRLHVDGGSSIELPFAQTLRLAGGRIYLDTDGADADVRLDIATPAGSVRHVGTRFQVRVGVATTEVWVREGRVELQPGRADVPREARAGQRLAAEPDGPVEVTDAPTWGEPWAWVDEATPPFQGDDRTVGALLDWLARESGRHLAYSTPEVRREAEAVRLHGQLSLGVDEALSVINDTTDFEARIDGERIEVSIRAH